MKRVLLILGLVLLIGLAGCVEGPSDNGNDSILDEEGAEESDAPASDTDNSDDSDTQEDESDDSPTGMDPPPAVEGELELHHIDVGQADSTLVVTPANETILIDTGDWRPDGAEVIEYLENRDIDRIDHLIASHAHADHIGGHATLIEHFEENGDGIGDIYDSGVPHDSQTYENYLDAVDEHDHELLIVEEGDELPLETENMTATVLNPPVGDSGDDLHYNSVSLTIEFGEVQYLTTGDAEDDAETRMIGEWSAALDADIYQAGHHGSSTSSTEEFLEIVGPDVAIISSALESQYGHPHDEILERFDVFGIETYWTGVHGDIVITTDGDEITTEPTADETTDPLALLELKDANEDDGQNSYSLPGFTQIGTQASA